MTDRFTGDPIAGAAITADGAGAVYTAEDGVFRLTAVPGVALEVTAADYDPTSAAVPIEGDVTVPLRPNVVTGTVGDSAGAAVAGVRVFVDGTENVVDTDEEGRYRIGDVPADGVLVYKAAGYRLAEREVAEVDASVIDVELEPFAARALYAPAGVFEAPGRLDAMLELIDRTEANAMVIDVKETDGQLYYATDLRTAVEVGAVREQPILDLETLLPMLHERGIYAIARMVVAKDNTLATAHPELAVENVVTGGPWTDNLGGMWLDPFKPGVWEYVLSIASDLADKGFDEVQLDYVRFLSDGPFEQASLVLPDVQTNRLPAMRRLFRMASWAFDHRRAFLAADIFPISLILADDQGIGQREDVVMPYLDYVCPMLYPSHFGAGLFGYDVPNTAPYEVLDGSLEIITAAADGLPVKIRPWIQDFGYGPFPPYTADQVRAEMQALYDNGVEGWMIWNPQAEFTEAALAPQRDGE
ncbi:MAG: carboxypeptidase regulatory-like domain-containing protein [Chloroflexota bacterium]|nr:carboxypeptidase regulatory-like domain-containing protein [Chloroflexota bacterium]